MQTVATSLGSSLLGPLALLLLGAATLVHCTPREPDPVVETAAGGSRPSENAAARETIPARATTQAPKEAPKGESSADDDAAPERTLKEQRQKLFHTMQTELDLSTDQLGEVKRIFAASPVLGQGNPAISKHPMTRAECRAARAEAAISSAPREPCSRTNMVPVYDPEGGETAKDAKVCIDRYEFPNIACEYPVVHVSAREAALLCQAVGKRICDAHEWEGACAGDLRPVAEEYGFDKTRQVATREHNQEREKRWAYGPEKNHALCATGSFKTPGCPGGGYGECGSNTYPAGAFPQCVSTFGVYDQHGNAAEHMNLPLQPSELASRGGTGSTEMKGSWFIFQKNDAHEDDCRWRAKDWHPSKLMSEESHENYHLGFRCCADVEAAG